MNNSVELLFWGFGLSFLFMTILWLVQRKTGNAGIVDIGWSLIIPLLAIVYAALTWSFQCPNAVVAVTLTALWGSRLALHIHARSSGKPEDARYADLKETWGNRAQVKMFFFYQFQAVAALIFSIPVLLVIQGDCANLNRMELVGAVIWFLAFLGEGSADRQLAQFKKSGSSEKVCRIGWWKYSRHPNYFFEWLIWIGTAIYTLSSPNGYIAFICPILMLFFLFMVTGIPSTEAQALRSKGDAYRDYQRTTSAFIPWFSKKT